MKLIAWTKYAREFGGNPFDGIEALDLTSLGFRKLGEIRKEADVTKTAAELVRDLAESFGVPFELVVYQAKAGQGGRGTYKITAYGR